MLVSTSEGVDSGLFQSSRADSTVNKESVYSLKVHHSFAKIH